MALCILVLCFVSKLRALVVLLVIILTTACSLMMQLSIYIYIYIYIYIGAIAPGLSFARWQDHDTG
jgi:hypothetical protein